MVPVFLVDGPARGEVVQVSEYQTSYFLHQPSPPQLFTSDEDLLADAFKTTGVTYQIDLNWLGVNVDQPRVFPLRVGWCESRPEAWRLLRMIDPDLISAITLRLMDGQPITSERYDQMIEASRPPVVDRHDVGWCRESDGNNACINTLHYGPCGHPNCYGACLDFGDCPCKCHIPERVRTGRPIRMRVSNTTPGDGK